jgi:penicillin-binding protein 1A
MKRLFSFSIKLFAVLLLIGVIGTAAGIGVFWHFGRGLPDYQQLADYKPPTVTRVHAGDGRLLTEFARQRRVFIPVDGIPKSVISAFLAAEDKDFYSHFGVDFKGILRAVITNIKHVATGQRLVGASTITQQVAKNFLLTNEVSFDRKIKEAILAIRIERVFSKDRILELYLNEIYLGQGSYGIAAAALNYFDRALDELTIPEIAYIAGLPKAPNNYHPTRRPEAAKIRRDYVIGRMLQESYITQDEADSARAEPLVVRARTGASVAQADYFVEEVRRELVDRFGEDQLYGGGLSVRTTLNSRLQDIADRKLRNGLIAYDRRHGWRGPLGQLNNDTMGWGAALSAFPLPKGLTEAMPRWTKAVVLKVMPDKAIIGLEGDRSGYIPLSALKWARNWVKGELLGPIVKHPAQVLKPYDVVLVEPQGPGKDGKPAPEGAFELRQEPEISGGLIALDPHTGRVLAMTGGFSFAQSEFNRVTQARRQPGSAFKPFVYLAALDHGFTPSSIVLDAPFVIDQGPGQALWKPGNYSRRFYGPSPLRLGIEKSRNLMTVRLAQVIGMETIVDYAKRFGVVEEMPSMLSMSLGAAETTLLDLTTGYAMLVNGGKRITPTLIDRIQDRNGKTIFQHEKRPCPKCRGVEWDGEFAPVIEDIREQVADPRSVYQIVSMLQGVVQRGTGRRIRAVRKPLGGKTGTTNDSIDTWFIGFSPDLAVGVFGGFDKPRSLGKRETGSSIAVPIFRDFMAEALRDKPPIPFRIPTGIRLVRVNAKTGERAVRGDRPVILEAFKLGTEPKFGETDRGPTSAGSLPGGGVKGLY